MTASAHPPDEPAAGPAGGSPSVGANPPITIRCREHGPLVFELPADAPCPVRVVDHLGRPFPVPTHKRTVALCRCGHSQTRPWCDGSHRDCGFAAADLAPDESAPATALPRVQGL